MKRLFVAAIAAFGLLGACATRATAENADDVGVLVMAHGGGPTWNGQVEAMLAPLREDYPLEIAFGMADPETMQDGVNRLEARGARRIAVVRLFISGESWYERTEQILGLSPGAPQRPAANGHEAHGEHAGHNMDLWRIDTHAAFAMSRQGLADAPEMGAVLAQRAHALSQHPQHESVLILAHGPEDDMENERWIAQINSRADAVRQAAPFRRVQVETLREDWPEKRAASEARIRAFVEQANRDGGRAIVIPYRVQGFGPYASVLQGLTYASDGYGLLPSAEVEHWVRRQVEEMRTAGFRAPEHAHDPGHAHHEG